MPGQNPEAAQESANTKRLEALRDELNQLQQHADERKARISEDLTRIRKQMEELLTLIKIIFVLLFLVFLVVCIKYGVHRSIANIFLDILGLEPKGVRHIEPMAVKVKPP